MTQEDLNLAVARVTGETVQDIAARGFSFVSTTTQQPIEPERDGPQYVDWDEVDRQRSFAFI